MNIPDEMRRELGINGSGPIVPLFIAFIILIIFGSWGLWQFIKAIGIVVLTLKDLFTV